MQRLSAKDIADQNNENKATPFPLKGDEETEVQVIGIYEILKPDSLFESIVTYEKLENQIFIDIDTLQNLFGDMPVGFYEVVFTVNDPAQLDSIITHDNYLSKCPSASSENLDIARYACDFLLCS